MEATPGMQRTGDHSADAKEEHVVVSDEASVKIVKAALAQTPGEPCIRAQVNADPEDRNTESTIEPGASETSVQLTRTCLAPSLGQEASEELGGLHAASTRAVDHSETSHVGDTVTENGLDILTGFVLPRSMGCHSAPHPASAITTHESISAVRNSHKLQANGDAFFLAPALDLDVVQASSTSTETDARARRTSNTEPRSPAVQESAPGVDAMKRAQNSPQGRKTEHGIGKACETKISDGFAGTGKTQRDRALLDGATSQPEGRGSRQLGLFTAYVFGFDPHPEEEYEELVGDAWSIAPKRRGIYNLVQVPTRLERLLTLCGLICADEFLFLFTFLPIRCVYALGRAFLSVAESAVRGRRWAESKHSRGEHQSDQQCIAGVIDWLHVSILVLASGLLATFDISWIYHSIRGQSVIKLYVVFNVMEIFDRLCCSFGVDILDSLGWTTASAVHFFISRSHNSEQFGYGSQRATVARSRAIRRFSLLARVAVDYMFTLVYVSIHATLLLTWVVTLNVAINTQNNALLTLLVSNNFVELKGAAFKSYKVQNLFQIACSDGVERFQQSVFLLVMLIYAEGDRRLIATWGIVFLSEVFVDWIKHAFVTKFNRIPHRAYQEFSTVICRDVVQARKNSAIRSIGGSGVAKRIGFVSLPLGALAVRMMTTSVCRLPALAVVLIFLIMLSTKVTLAVSLLGHASRRIRPQGARPDPDPHSSAAEEDEPWSRSLANVGRYDKS